MLSRDKHLAECGLHFVLAATYLSHQPEPQTIVAALAYLGLAALSLADREEDEPKRRDANSQQQPDIDSQPTATGDSPGCPNGKP